jgi:hypothetical protein
MHPYVRPYPTSDPSAPIRRGSGAAKRASAPPRKSRKTPVVQPQLAEPDVVADGAAASGPTPDVATDVVEVTAIAEAPTNVAVEDPGMTGALTAKDAAPEEVTEEVAKPAAGPVVTVDDFEDLFTRFQTPLINFVFRLVGNREQAYDLTQDVFVKAYRVALSHRVEYRDRCATPAAAHQLAAPLALQRGSGRRRRDAGDGECGWLATGEWR